MRPSLPLIRSTTFAAVTLLAACGSDPGSEAPPTASAVGDAPWVVHRDAQGAFEARFPAPPTVQELNPPRKPAEMQLNVTNAQHADETRLLVATKVLMTEVANYDCEAGLKGMVESSLAGMGCSASDEKPTELQGLPGREIRFTCQKRPMRGIMLIGCDARNISQRTATAFSMIAAYKNESWNAEEAATFVNSFVLLPTATQ